MSVKFKLTAGKEIKHGAESVSELEFREPIAKDFRPMPVQPTQGDLLILAGKLCQMPDSVLDQLSAKDHMRVMEIMAVFIGGGQEIGENA